MAAAICPPLLVIPPALVSLFAHTVVFAWAGAHAEIAVISVASAIVLAATAGALETIDKVCSTFWDLGRELLSFCKRNDEKEGGRDVPEHDVLGSTRQMVDLGLTPAANDSRLASESAFSPPKRGRSYSLSNDESPVVRSTVSL